MDIKDLTIAHRDQKLVKIITDKDSNNEEYRSFIIEISDKFIVTNLISDWHVDGVKIYPLDRISKCVSDETLVTCQKILSWNGVEKSTGYNWLDLTNFQSLFKSIKKHKKTILLILNDIAEVGEVLFTTDESVNLKALNSSGQWLDDICTVSFDEISSICIDDEYSVVLRKYAEEVTQEVTYNKTKSIYIQIQFNLDGKYNADDVIKQMKSVGLIPKIEKSDITENYINYYFTTDDPQDLWNKIKMSLLNNSLMGNWMKKVSVIACEGNFGWDDYLLLWSNSVKEEELDDL